MSIYEYGLVPKMLVSHCALSSSVVVAVEIPDAAGASLNAFFLVTILVDKHPKLNPLAAERALFDIS